MGKTNSGEEDQHQLASSNAENIPCCCNCLSRLVGLKCLFLLVLSVAVFLSAFFLLPPFQGDPDTDLRFKGHEIVASFSLKKPVSFLKENIVKLQEDICAEIEAPYIKIKVLVLHLKPLAGSNVTQVIFGVDSEVKNTKIQEPARSLIRSSFQNMVIKQLSLRLTTSFFGDTFSFEVLKFPGGIIIIPPQSAFLLQKVQVPFAFTLNFSIHQLQASFKQLSSQLKLGLHLAPYENLYIKLSNSKGSTVSSPTTLYASVLLEVGNRHSGPRLKQLAQTINGSNSGNLGLNNTEFGRVKGVSLSSILQHSLNGSDGSKSAHSPSPAPAPNPEPDHHYHQHHHHHHHHHNAQVSPAVSPAPSYKKGSSASHMDAPIPAVSSPVPSRSSPGSRRSHEAMPPGCEKGHGRKSSRKKRTRSFVAPAVPPEMSHHHNAPSPTVVPKISPHYNAPTPSIAQKVPSHHAGPSPHGQIRPGAPGSVSASSPLPSVQFPSNDEPNGGSSVATPPVSSSYVSSGETRYDTVRGKFWKILSCVVVLYQLSSN